MTLTSPMDELLGALGQLGFSQYEARAYCALAAGPAMNGHEVARASGIPPSKIYETLARLAEKGAVIVQHADPVIYAASPRDAVLHAAKAKFERALSTAEAGLKELPARSESSQIWSLKERDAVLAATTGIVGAARRSVFAAVWQQELDAAGPALEAASRRGCTVHVAIYGTATLDGPRSYDLSLCGQSAVERLAGRRLTAFVADEAETLVAEFRADGSVEAVRTANPVIGLLTIEYIKADILGRLLINDLGNDRFEELRRGESLMDALLRS
ncbi:TrmB family transcriptional regulator [Radicibacter daui]|uniref:TrmB family transcriptional regulator n=1 Tax=Radicibacter daui TaxID=3064829 RepID=UPI004046B2F6